MDERAANDLADIGLIGLGVMGSNLALNMAENGYRVALYDRDSGRAVAMANGEFGEKLVPCDTPAALLQAIRAPRPVIMLVPAGQATDGAIADLRPHLAPGDILIDAGNSDFHDTRRRTAALEGEGFGFLGMGVSGGAEGARNGPAIMAGGSREVWGRVAPILKDIAARHGDAPCADWLGPDGAGHFVKTIHNGIEYADMQMIAEVYGIMRDGMGMSAAEIGGIFGKWADGPLASYLIDIAGSVATSTDAETGRPMLDVILDRAGQKGTGRWSVVEAVRLGAVVSTIEAAVSARNHSGDGVGRQAMADASRPDARCEIDVSDLHDALLFGKIVAYAQGFEALRLASEEYAWSLDMATVARVWRAGCIIRSAVLDEMAVAFDVSPERSLLAVPDLAAHLHATGPALRRVVTEAIGAGLPVPALAAALGHVDQLAQPRGTTNMIQGLRDFFGQHGFERIDRDGAGFHGDWLRS